MTRIRLSVSGMHCAACAARVEQALRSQDGVEDASVNLAMAEAAVLVDPSRADTERLRAAVAQAGYQAEAVRAEAASTDDLEKRQQREVAWWRTRLLAGLGLLLPLAALHSLGGHAPWAVGLTLPVATAMQFFVGWPYFAGALSQLRRGGVSMDTLVALGTGAAYGAGLGGVVLGEAAMSFLDAALILAFVTLGKYLEAKARGRTSAAIRKLMALTPPLATVARAEGIVTVPAADVAAGETLILRAGDAIPLDAVVLFGESDVDESWLTGESQPVDKRPGDTVFAGTLNGQGSLKARVSQTAGHTALARVIELVRRAQESKTRVQRLADRVVAWFVPAVLGLAVLSLAAWSLSGDVNSAMRCAVAVLVVACPCALGLATPTAVVVGCGRGAEQGILIKDAAALEIAARITTVVLDKTGTITVGQPRIQDVQPHSGNSVRDVLTWAAAAEQLSNHPLAKAVLAKAHEQGITIPEAQRLSIVPGQGVEAEAGGCAILVGGEQLLQDRGIPIEPPWLASLAQKRQSGHTALLVAKDGGFLGALYATDIPRPGSGEAVRQLERLGLRVVMLSGDRRQTAERIAQAVGIQEVVAEVLPGEKQAAVQRLREQGERVAMVGDGINDAPALVAADLGIAVGSGTDIAIESADLVLMREDLRSVPQAIRLARATFRTIQQNLAWAFLYNILLLPLAAGVFEPLLGLGLPPALAALAMALSSVSVVTNSLLLRFRVSRGELGNITPRR